MKKMDKISVPIYGNLMPLDKADDSIRVMLVNPNKFFMSKWIHHKADKVREAIGKY